MGGMVENKGPKPVNTQETEKDSDPANHYHGDTWASSYTQVPSLEGKQREMGPKQFYWVGVEQYIKEQLKFFLSDQLYSKLDILSHFPIHSQEEF